MLHKKIVWLTAFPKKTRLKKENPDSRRKEAA